MSKMPRVTGAHVVRSMEKDDSDKDAYILTIRKTEIAGLAIFPEGNKVSSRVYLNPPRLRGARVTEYSYGRLRACLEPSPERNR
jgi:hypothetical protein